MRIHDREFRRSLARPVRKFEQHIGAKMESTRMSKASRHLLRVQARAEEREREAQRVTAAQTTLQFLACVLLLAKGWLVSHGRASKSYRVSRRDLWCPQLPARPWLADLQSLVDRAEGGDAEAQTELRTWTDPTASFWPTITTWHGQIIDLLPDVVDARNFAEIRGMTDEMHAAMVSEMRAVTAQPGQDSMDLAEWLLLRRLDVSGLLTEVFKRLSVPADALVSELRTLCKLRDRAQQVHLRTCDELGRYRRASACRHRSGNRQG